MKVYLGNDNKEAEIKRLVKLKADLGLCLWYKDFKGANIDLESLVEAIDNQLDEIKMNYEIVKEFTEEEDMTYFDVVNSNENLKSVLNTGIINVDAKNVILNEGCPKMLEDIISQVMDNKYILIL